MSAIEVRRACKSYGSKSNRVEVLKEFSMNVQQGSMYEECDFPVFSTFQFPAML
jgi:hypothetical protein